MKITLGLRDLKLSARGKQAQDVGIKDFNSNIRKEILHCDRCIYDEGMIGSPGHMIYGNRKIIKSRCGD